MTGFRSRPSPGPSVRPSNPIPAVIAILAVSAFPVDGAIASVVDAHREIRRLDREFLERQIEGDTTGQEELIRRMAAADPENPLPYIRSARLFRPKERRPQALAFMESLGSEGPGLTFGEAMLAWLHENRREEALDAFRDLVLVYRELDHAPGEAGAHLGLAQAADLRRADEREPALAETHRAMEIYDRIGDTVGVAWTLRRRAMIEERMGSPAPALATLDEAVRLFESEGLRSGVAAVRHTAGDVARRAGRYDLAIENYEIAAANRRELGDPVTLAISLTALVDALQRAERNDEALLRIEETVALHEQTGNLDSAAHMLDVQATQLERMGRFDEAEATHLRAVEVGAEARPRRHLQNEASLGAFHRRRGEFQRAAEVYESLLEHAVEYENRYYEGIAALMSGELATLAGDQARALELMERGKAALGTPRPGTATAALLQGAVHDLARVYFNIGLLDTAAGYLDESLSMAATLRKGRQAAEGKAWSGIGVVRDAQGKLDEAIEAHRKSLAIRLELDDPQGLGWSQLNAAHTFWRAGRRDEANALLDDALANFRVAAGAEEIALAMNIRGEFRRDEGRLPEALADHAEAIREARRAGIQQQVWVGRMGRGLTYEASGKPAKALREYTAAIDVVESLRARMVTDEFKMRFFATTVALYERAVIVQAKLETGAAPRTFRLAESARARSLADLLVDSRQGLREGLSPETARLERELADAVTTAVMEIDSAPDKKTARKARRVLREAEESLQRLQLTIRRESPVYSEIAYPEPIELRTVQTELLRGDEALLRYFVGEEEALLWVVTRESASLHRLAAPDEIVESVGRLRARETRLQRPRGNSDGALLAESLAELLLPTTLPEKSHLLIVPDGPLHHLPFEVLRHEGRYLIESRTVAVVPSASSLKVMRTGEQPVAAGGLAAIGDPLIPEDLALPPVTDILDSLATLFDDPPPLLVRGAEATRERLLGLDLSGYRFIHFATHGILDAEDPKSYGLLLSPPAEGERPGMLHTVDVSSLRLASELVVLAACQSGAGEQLQGEGLVGMTRAFLFAGARALLVSLWNVDDRATADFMEALYTRLAAGQSAPEALRATKLSFLQSDRPLRRRIYQWAPFVLIGDPSVPINSEVLNPGKSAATPQSEGAD